MIIFIISFSGVNLTTIVGQSTFSQVHNKLSNNFEIQTTPRDYWPTAGWINSTPEDQSMNSSKLNEMLEQIHENNYLFDSKV